MRTQQQNPQNFALTDIESFYQAAKKRFDTEPNFADEARAWVVKLQAHETESLTLWQRFIDLSLTHCQAIYQRLGVGLTPKDIRAESAYNDELALIIKSLAQQQLLTIQDDTKCVFLDQFKGKDQNPLPIIVQKKDGGYLYATTDLAALQYRQSVLHADRILYVVDARQSLHFQQIFALAVKANFVDAKTELEHIEFGMILDKAGRPFKSRDGGVTKLSDLLDEAEQRADELIAHKNPQMDPNERKTMAAIIGIAAVKYADLSKNRISDYMFDWDTMLSFEGNTAPYLLYANTRIHSLFHKAGTAMADLTHPFQLESPPAITLAKHLVQFSDCIHAVVLKSTPHLLCTYLYELAGLFSSFYEACPILTADNPATQQNLLKLAGLTSRVLEQGLTLLGIKTLKHM
jgi:arginyl-tRNA synthetase